jgi:hypothetical protein
LRRYLPRYGTKYRSGYFFMFMDWAKKNTEFRSQNSGVRIWESEAGEKCGQAVILQYNC